MNRKLMSEPTRQSVDNLRGEIEFRRKLAHQHTTGDLLLPDYFGKDDHDAILQERIETTRRTFLELEKQGLKIRPFVELGAERGHRALALVNHLQSAGFACDLSLDQLRTAPHFARQFGLSKVPDRICCDANNLPFRSHSLPFIFCYQFLHHFPSLEVIVPEIHRALGEGGTFFFDEEPLGRYLQLHLYKQKEKEYSRSNLRKGKLLRWLEGFISEASSDEVDHGIIENHAMKLGHWRKEFSIFEGFKAEVRTLRYLRSKVGKSWRIQNVPQTLVGGVISGIASKTGEERDPHDLWSTLICPGHGKGKEFPLTREGDFHVCEEAGCRYPVVDDVPILIEESLRRKLYPEFG